MTPYGASAAGNVSVTLGGVAATVTSVSDTLINITLPALASGNYQMQVEVEGVGIALASPANLGFSVALYVGSVAPVRGSMAGGTSVTVSGYGFASDVDQNHVMICNVPCEPTAVTSTQLVCISGPILTPTSTTTYKLGGGETLLSGAETLASYTARGELAFDSNISTNYDHGSDPCWVGIDLGYGTAALLTKVRLIPYFSGWGRSQIAGLQVQGSHNGSTWSTVYTIMDEAATGWNTYDMPENITAYRYLRVSKAGFHGIELTTFTDVAACPIKVEVDADDVSESNVVVANQTFEYSTADTPTITGLSPTMGS
eukprot:CAMPEP_0114267548 /NCGR_PEP_ID=MMETSP0058-20121206/25377_1 /TAXON_ID=36894 /ORGANISM="Pyramimonas parkeae, CCMP726" /LENGTH=313 /DNA_ID=CAMNT_0001385453 /DNA_START=8 /DNA_END=947 /DNA_ORIENTATION=-